MGRSQIQTSGRSSIGSDEPLFESQNLIDSSQNENQIKSPKVTNSQSFGIIKSSQLSLFSSQSSPKRMDEWKGCQVINFKTFKKHSQNSSQKSSKSEVIPLKRIKVDLNQIISSDETNDEILDKTLDLEKSNKRKINAKEEIESTPLKKKSRN